MADRPILFSAPMVRALLDGRKTQTRRVLKPPYGTMEWLAGEWRPIVTKVRPGERLWVRETWRPVGVLNPWDIEVIYNADGEHRHIADGDFVGTDWTMPKAAKVGNVSPLFMPRWASRLTLTVTEVRVQRLQDISEEDARAEGATHRLECSGFMNRDIGWSMDWSKVGQPSRFAHDGKLLAERDISLGSAVAAFAGFINELHDPRWNYRGDGIFGENPWVAAYSFTVERRNIDGGAG